MSLAVQSADLAVVTLVDSIADTKSAPSNTEMTRPLHVDIPHTLGSMLLHKTPIEQKLQYKDIVHWNHIEEDRLDLVNISTPTNTKLLKLNANLSPKLRHGAVSLFMEYIDIFVFSYKSLRGIPKHIATYRIDLDPSISPSHQARYHTNPNYAQVVKDDLERLLTAGFITPVNKATWLSPIIMVPKKNGKLRICVDFH